MGGIDDDRIASQPRPLRVLFALAEFPVLSQTFIADQITGLMERGFDVRIWALRMGEEQRAHARDGRFRLRDRTEYLDFPRCRAFLAAKLIQCILRLATKAPANVLKVLSPWRPWEIRERVRAIYWADVLARKDPSADMIICNHGQVALHFAWIYPWLPANAKLVAVFHGNDVGAFADRFGSQIYGPLFTRAHLIVATCQALAQRLIRFGCPKEKLVTSILGVDIDEFEHIKERPPPAPQTVFIFVGRLVEKKGAEYAIRAAEMLNSRSDWRLLIIGDGPLRPQLARLVQNLGISDRVMFLGSKSNAEVRKYLNESHVMMQPSITASDGDVESMPIVLKEAMANGMPVISTHHSGIPELVEHGSTGFLTPERAIEALARCMERFLDDPCLISVMGNRARRAIEDRFDNAKLNDEFAAALNACSDSESEVS